MCNGKNEASSVSGETYNKSLPALSCENRRPSKLNGIMRLERQASANLSILSMDTLAGMANKEHRPPP
ncbi:hypothetical protein DERP_002883 [Dermatophagoides pteronyssinus]|uniref:Uncharacterized protein n=1 Tax=Dermatophagoides pteronyssinus TaxID=6956 RepID=A0ABQ8JWG6_DERPT|nr:hypothetical protein DERP_002883 [Dermatophagoides pteronyssinus]